LAFAKHLLPSDRTERGTQIDASEQIRNADFPSCLNRVSVQNVITIGRMNMSSKPYRPPTTAWKHCLGISSTEGGMQIDWTYEPEKHDSSISLNLASDSKVTLPIFVKAKLSDDRTSSERGRQRTSTELSSKQNGSICCKREFGSNVTA
jgi:hypothetical protein